MDKNDLIREIEFSMQMYLDKEQMQMLDNVLYTKLKDIDLTNKETLPSVNIDDTNNVIQYYLNTLNIENKSKRTICAYRYSIKKFFLYVDCNFRDVDKFIIKDYLLYLKNKGNNEMSLNSQLKNLKAFYKWLEIEEIITKNPFLTIKPIKEPYIIKKVLTDEEIEYAKSCCKNQRQSLLLDICSSTGMRCEELTKLKFDDINFIESLILVHGKGNKERYVPLSPKCKVELKKIKKENMDKKYVFESKFHNKISMATLQSDMRKLKKISNISGLKIHGIRAYFCTKMINRKIDNKTLTSIMGHSNINTSLKYYARTNEKNIISACNILN